jgi:hypothetical protein
MPQPFGVFCPSPWYIFVRISFYRVFNPSTQELHHGEESKEGDEKESEEEEVISTLTSVGVALLSATYRFGGWTRPAAFLLRGMYCEF